MKVNIPVKSIMTAMLLIISFLGGCDRFHKGSVLIDPRVLQAPDMVADEATEKKVASIVNDFASRLQFECRPLFQRPGILECGPAWHRKITIDRKDDRFVVTLFEMHPGWNDSPLFCSIQGQMFEYFIQQFGATNVKAETNDTCGRKNYP